MMASEKLNQHLFDYITKSNCLCCGRLFQAKSAAMAAWEDNRLSQFLVPPERLSPSPKSLQNVFPPCSCTLLTTRCLRHQETQQKYRAIWWNSEWCDCFIWWRHIWHICICVMSNSAYDKTSIYRRYLYLYYQCINLSVSGLNNTAVDQPFWSFKRRVLFLQKLIVF